MRAYYFLVLFLLGHVFSTAQTDTTYAERLGFPKGKKVVILHVDDVGMSFDSNEGAIQAITKGVATSCSIMMPCPWVPGFFHFLEKHPSFDAGLHLTLTSEWKDYRWGPVAGISAVPGLVDREGAMWASVPEVVKNASADEVEKEIRSQLEKALKAGWKPTHIDSHMGTLFANPAFTEKYLKLGIEYQIPVMFPGGHNTLIAGQIAPTGLGMAQARKIGKMLWDAGLPVLDDLHNDSYGWKPPKGVIPSKTNLQKEKTKYYINALRSLKPGITMVIMHCTDPTELFPHITDSGTTREADLLAMMDPALKAFIRKECIILTNWRELMERRQKVK